jgi:hypothetical protein
LVPHMEWSVMTWFGLLLVCVLKSMPTLLGKLVILQSSPVWGLAERQPYKCMMVSLWCLSSADQRLPMGHICRSFYQDLCTLSDLGSWTDGSLFSPNCSCHFCHLWYQ